MTTNYYINANYLMERTYAGTDLDRAMELADKNACYTQQKINIELEDGTVECTRLWYGVEFDPEEYEEGERTDVICFGAFGHYAPWDF